MLSQAVHRMFSRTINTFSITPITMRRQVRRWPPQGKHNYDVVNIKGDPTREILSPWAEGVEGDGIGESITLNVKRPLPLYGILIQPGYYDYDDKEPWLKNNRVAALEITLNDEQRLLKAFPMSYSNVRISSACGITQNRLTKSKW